MSFVIKNHLSVDTNCSLFSFLSDRYDSIPNDSDKSDKRSQCQKRQGLRDSDKSKTPMTKGAAIPFSILNRGFCHCVFCRIARLCRPSTKAFRLLSLLSLSREVEPGTETMREGPVKSLTPQAARPVAKENFFLRGFWGRGVPRQWLFFFGVLVVRRLKSCYIF